MKRNRIIVFIFIAAFPLYITASETKAIVTSLPVPTLKEICMLHFFKQANLLLLDQLTLDLQDDLKDMSKDRVKKLFSENEIIPKKQALYLEGMIKANNYLSQTPEDIINIDKDMVITCLSKYTTHEDKESILKIVLNAVSCSIFFKEIAKTLFTDRTVSLTNVEYIIHTMIKNNKPHAFDVIEFVIENTLSNDLTQYPYSILICSKTQSEEMRTRLLRFMKKTIEYKHSSRTLRLGIVCALNQITQHNDERFREVLSLFSSYMPDISGITPVSDRNGRRFIIGSTPTPKMKRTMSLTKIH